MFGTGWTLLLPADARAQPGTTVAMLAAQIGCGRGTPRVIYRVGEGGDVERRGFAYGTLLGHAARGEERSTVSWDRRDGSVRYEALAMSRPNHPLAWAGYPLARALQRRFARNSKRTMARATDLRGAWVIIARAMDGETFSILEKHARKREMSGCG